MAGEAREVREFAELRMKGINAAYSELKERGEEPRVGTRTW
jgi:hypothetical protein